MKKSTKLITSAMLATAIISPNLVFATNNTLENEKNINIDIDKTTVFYKDTSNISIKFKENPKSDSITINFLCYDMPLSATLNYNSNTNSYEGIINFNKEPEYLNVWKIENITINSETPEVLDKTKLEELGLNLSDYDIHQEYIVTNNKSLSQYIKKTSAPVKELVGINRSETAAKISQEGWKDGSEYVILVNGNAIADGVTATPLATTYDAPILLVNNDNIPESTKNEITRLNPKNIILIGGNSVISESLEKELKSTTSSNVSRIEGKNRFETSLEIAKKIDDDHDVNKIFIANGYKGESDALTIAAKAGQDKQPIILSEKTKLTNEAYNWLKNEGLTNAYFIGGEINLTTDIIHQVAKITKTQSGESVYKNRIYGKNRYETNAKVMEKFYPEKNLKSVLVSKGDILVDALTAGPLAAKLKSPILLTNTDSLSSYHNDNLNKKIADLVYKVGGGIKDSVIEDIAYKLSEHTSGEKTVIIDPGHGGSAPGNIEGGIKEKDFTLDVSLAATDYLRKNGINVIMTRETDTNPTFADRVGIGNSIGADLFTSIHFNSFTSPSANGIEVFYKVADKNGGKSKSAATNVINSVLSKFNLRNRGIKTKTNSAGTDYYYVIRESKIPAILVEGGFMSSPKDMAMIDELHERQLMGSQIGKGIENTLK